MRIPDNVIEEIRERADLAAHVSRHAELRRVGQNLRGLCPFHGEKTPSFYVHPERQRYYCFGCKASGDVFSLLMELDGYTFVEAAEKLAEELGIEIPQEGQERVPDRQQKAKARGFALLEAATAFYEEQLVRAGANSAAHAALAEREVSPAVVKAFRLGFAPDAWDHLAQYLEQRGFRAEEGESMGLLSPRRGGRGMYDRFRNRLMFPIADTQGRVVAFSGRRLGEETDPSGGHSPKYVNSPETPLYRKGETLFGLFQSRVGLRRKRFALICEGNFDVLALHRHGYDVTVAPLGTAFTEAQARLLQRYVEDVVLVFDGDAAGQKAVAAAQQVTAGQKFGVKVVSLPPGHDPDSFLRTEGSAQFEASLRTAPTVVEHLIDLAARRGGRDGHARGKAIAELAPLLATVTNPVERSLYVERVAKRFEVRDIDTVRAALRAGYLEHKRGKMPRLSSAGASKASSERDAEPDAIASRASKPRENDAAAALEREILGAIFDQPTIIDHDSLGDVVKLLTNEEVRDIFYSIKRSIKDRGSVDHLEILRLHREICREKGTSQQRGTSQQESAQQYDGERHSVEDGLAAVQRSGSAGELASWLDQRIAVPEFASPDEALDCALAAMKRLRRRRNEGEMARLKKSILTARSRGEMELAEALTRRHMELFRGTSDSNAATAVVTAGRDGAMGEDSISRES